MDSLATPMPMADHEASSDADVADANRSQAPPVLIYPTTTTIPHASSTSSSSGSGAPSPARSTGMKRPFEEEFNNQLSPASATGAITTPSPTLPTPGLLVLPPLDDGAMDHSGGEPPAQSSPNSTMDTSSAPTTTGAMSISVGLTMQQQQRQSDETHALYSALLPQPINSPASASSFTSLSLATSLAPSYHAAGSSAALASPAHQTPTSHPFHFSPSHQLAQFNSAQQQQSQPQAYPAQYPTTPAPQQLRPSANSDDAMI